MKYQLEVGKSYLTRGRGVTKVTSVVEGPGKVKTFVTEKFLYAAQDSGAHYVYYVYDAEDISGYDILMPAYELPKTSQCLVRFNQEKPAGFGTIMCNTKEAYEISLRLRSAGYSVTGIDKLGP